MFVSIITAIDNRIWENNASGEEKEYDGGLGQPYSQRKWAENYYGKQENNTVPKEKH